MTVRQLVSMSVAASAIVAASPVVAQPEMTYEERAYEYARTVPTAPEAQQIIYRQQPVIQPLPAVRNEAAAGADYAVQDDYRTPQPEYRVEREIVTRTAPQQVVYAQNGAQPVIYPHHSGQQPVIYQGHNVPHHAVQYPHLGQVQPHQNFDRDAWLDECRDRVGGGQRRNGNGNVIGGLVGAAAGGLIGNRIAGRGDRLGGTLIGAGVGGLAGLAIGSAIDNGNHASRDDVSDYCEQYLAYYSNGYGQQGHYYGHQQMMLVPVLIQVPQRAVTREIVTYETVEEHVTTYEHVPAQRHVAPRPTKRIKLAPQPTKRVRYIKGN